MTTYTCAAHSNPGRIVVKLLKGRARAPRECVSGAALPGVLVLISALLVASAAGFEVLMSEARSVAAFASRSIAFHAAEAALAVCERSLAERVAFAAEPTRASLSSGGEVLAVAGEPEGWRQRGALEGPAALHPFAHWPGAAAAPSCLIERWPIASRPRWQAYLLTARGTGSTRATTVWLQLQLAFEDGRQVARRWRRVAAAPW
ncbi:MAG: pilus assembly protein [Burkholderia gladioli]|uniref:pilus assembly PilX family protein n=1 Tax=Burkholderia gladioli TaxID=28095 RepID=UPI0009BC8C0F|nr:pilus assembly protein [Burkholderia gladioli]